MHNRRHPQISKGLHAYFFFISVSEMYMKKLKEQYATDHRILKWRGKSCPPPLPQWRCLLQCPWQEVTGVLSLSWSSVCCRTVWDVLASRWAEFPEPLTHSTLIPKQYIKSLPLFTWQPFKCLKAAIWSLFRLPFPGNTSSIPWGEEESAVLNSVLHPPGACLHLLCHHLHASCDYPLHNQENGGSWDWNH